MLRLRPRRRVRVRVGVKVRVRVSSASPDGAGVALVQMTIASQEATAALIDAASVTSATATASAGTPEATSASRLASDRTIPSGANSAGRASILRKTLWPVCPPAPVTATRHGFSCTAWRGRLASNSGTSEEVPLDSARKTVSISALSCTAHK